MNRRYFLSALAASASVRVARPAGARITRITVAPIEGRFHKFVTINAYDRVPKGHTYANQLIRIQTSEGVEGVGVLGYRASDEAFMKALRTLIGADPLALYQMTDGRITGRAQPFADTSAHLSVPRRRAVRPHRQAHRQSRLAPARRQRPRPRGNL